MGRTVTPKYRLVIDGCYRSSWRGNRKPTDADLESYIMAYAKSLEPGGCNFHLSESKGFIPYPFKARVETNTVNPTVVATWKAGMFQVW